MSALIRNNSNREQYYTFSQNQHIALALYDVVHHTDIDLLTQGLHIAENGAQKDLINLLLEHELNQIRPLKTANHTIDSLANCNEIIQLQFSCPNISSNRNLRFS